jgi:mannose-1-phosphate guanylyltransferase
MHEHYYAVIMAGGGGTRLWPLSRRAQPKQMLRLFDERSLFRVAVDRLNGIFPPQRILVVTVEEQAELLRADCPQIPANNYLLEPTPRGTASVIGFAAVALQQRDPQATMAVLTADHFIGNLTGFHELLEAAYQSAQEGRLVTLGITPTYAGTGFGYIQQGEKLGEHGGLSAYRVLRFREKPDQAAAEAMIAGGDHAWNSGMFVWRAARILDEFAAQMPALSRGLQQIAAAWQTPQWQVVIAAVWAELQAQTIDYGIMEGAQDVAVIPADGLQWNDVGSWESLFDVLPGDAEGNIVRGGGHIGLNTHGSLIYTNQEDRLVVTIGVDDLVIVDTGDVLLVCRRDQAQNVRQVVQQLKATEERYI